MHVGQLCEKEGDFVAVKDERIVYFQVTDEMLSEAIRERELKPLRSIRDSYEKLIVVRQGRYESDICGIKMRLREFVWAGGCVTAPVAWASGPSALASRGPWAPRCRGARGPAMSLRARGTNQADGWVGVASRAPGRETPARTPPAPCPGGRKTWEDVAYPQLEGHFTP